MSAFSIRARLAQCRSCAPLLLPFSEGHLDARKSARVEAHLALCPSCQSDLATIREVARVLATQREKFAPVATDLWERIEAEIQRSPQTAGRSGAPSFNAPRRRTSTFGVFGWSQALPIAATAFAAVILVMALTKPSTGPAARSLALSGAAEHAAIPISPPTSQEAEVGAPSQSSESFVATAGKHMAPLRPHMPQGATLSGRPAKANESELSIATLHVGRIHSERRKPSLVAVNFAHRAASSVSQLAQSRSGADHQAALADAAFVRKPVFGNVLPSVLPNSESRNASSSASPGGERVAAVTYVASNLPTHGGYAADDETETNVSVADLSRSVRRQQELFSYNR